MRCHSVRARAAYFHDATIHSVRIQAGTLTDVGRIRLMAPCEESPGTVCFVLHGPAGEISEGGGKIEMSDLCAVDLDERQPWCPGTRVMPGPFSSNGDLLPDFRFHVANDGIWLVPLNGALFSLNPSTVTYKRGCPDATYAPDPIRIDGLPPESRACVRTHRGGYAELRFNEQIAPKQKTATVDFIYWDN